MGELAKKPPKVMRTETPSAKPLYRKMAHQHVSLVQEPSYERRQKQNSPASTTSVIAGGIHRHSYHLFSLGHHPHSRN
jgi:hypothetical protein